jgi:hypothetical protein
MDLIGAAARRGFDVAAERREVRRQDRRRQADGLP